MSDIFYIFKNVIFTNSGKYEHTNLMNRAGLYNVSITRTVIRSEICTFTYGFVWEVYSCCKRDFIKDWIKFTKSNTGGISWKTLLDASKNYVMSKNSEQLFLERFLFGKFLADIYRKEIQIAISFSFMN